MSLEAFGDEDDYFLTEALEVLNWQGGTKRQVLAVIKAAREVACARKEAEVMGSYDLLPGLLDILEDAFFT